MAEKFLGQEGAGVLVEKIKDNIKNIEGTKGRIDTLEAGVNQVYTKTAVDGKLGEKANSADVYTKEAVYTKQEIDDKDFASKADVDSRVDEIIDGAPEAFDTLKEIADELAKNDNLHAAITEAMGNRYTKTEVDGKLDKKANSADVYTKTEVDGKLGEKATPTDIDDAVAALDSTATSTDGVNMQVKVTEVDGKITEVNIVGDNTASMNDLNERVPENGKPGQVLCVNENGKTVWMIGGASVSLNTILDKYSYGISWIAGQKDPIVTRIGNMEYHKTLPIQSRLAGCVSQGKNIQYYLDSENWANKVDGTPARLDGYDGQVTVDTGAPFYIKSGTDTGNRMWVRIASTQIDNTWVKVPRMLVAAYRGTILRSVPENMGWLSTLPANSMVSIANTATYCRGGGNRSSYDAYLTDNPFRSDLGKPATYIPRATMRTYARQVPDQELLSYEDYKDILYWLWVIERGTFRSRGPWIEEKTAEGFLQGGMGDGATWDSTSWSNFNGYYPVIPCGYTNEIGNGTGRKALTIPATEKTSATTFMTWRWRGFENDWDIWTNLDGFVMEIPINSSNTAVPPEGLAPIAHIITDPSKYTDSLAAAKTNAVRSVVGAPSSCWYSEFNLGESADIVPMVSGGDSTLCKTDHYWVDYNDGPCTLLVGADLDRGSRCGLGAFYVYGAVGYSWASVGFRGVTKLD